MKRRDLCLLTGLAITLLGCGNRTEQYILPDQITDFSALFGSNCAGCHGPDGRSGAARPLNDPLYLALIGKERLRDVIAKGVSGTAMPPFAQNAGGTLTDQQVTILADQMQARWSRPRDFVGVTLPPYSAEPGDPADGEAVFHSDCVKCHGDHGVGGLIVDPAFLALISDQSIRTAVITGRADRGMPDWRSHGPGPAMTAQEISDVVAWLSAHREVLEIQARGGTSLP
jgi:cytochrome c oxidase cbb3-type subunit 3/ubiquinol-cytochrome c reductase cytochrome c subunit